MDEENIKANIEENKTEGSKVAEKEEVGGSQLQLTQIVEACHDAIIGKTLDGIITSWNGGAVRMFGYKFEEIVGKSMVDLFPPELKGELSLMLARIKKGETVNDHDLIFIKKDGSRATVEFAASPIINEKEEVVGISFVGRDVTEQRKTEAHIKELNEVRSKFMNIISHQLRTPLTAVNWNLESILNGKFGKLDDIMQKFLQITYNESIETTNRINDLLVAMDIEEGRILFKTEDASIDSIVASVIAEESPKCKLKIISFKYIAPATALNSFEVDIEKIRLVVKKLFDNAITYTKENGKIVVKLEKKGNGLRLEIKDNGIGIPLQEQKYVFTRFFRGSNASLMINDAFGIGLFMCKSFIDQHHGKIGFESEEGVGSTFWFEIPERLDN